MDTEYGGYTVLWGQKRAAPELIFFLSPSDV